MPRIDESRLLNGEYDGDEGGRQPSVRRAMREQQVKVVRLLESVMAEADVLADMASNNLTTREDATYMLMHTSPVVTRLAGMQAHYADINEIRWGQSPFKNKSPVPANSSGAGHKLF